AEDGIRDRNVTGVQTCALPIFMDVEVADEAVGGTEDSPAAAAGWVVLIMSIPRELYAAGAVAGAVADVEEALQRAEGDLAVGRRSEERRVGKEGRRREPPDPDQ